MKRHNSSSSESGGSECTLTQDRFAEVLFDNGTIRELKGHKKQVVLCKWSKTGNYLASGSNDSSALVWDMRTSENTDVPNQMFEFSAVKLLHFEENAIGSITERENIEDQKKANLYKTLTDNNEEKNNDGSNVKMDEVQQKIKVQERPNDIKCLDWLDDYTLATGSYDGRTRIWTRDGFLKSEQAHHTEPILDIKFNFAGTFLITAGADNTVVVYDVENEYVIQTLSRHTDMIQDMQWFTNTLFATCSSDNTVIINEVRKDSPFQVYQSHTSEVNSVRYDAATQRIASCSDDMQIHIWQLNCDKPMQVLIGHTHGVYNVRWSTRPDELGSSSFDRTVKIWDLKTGHARYTIKCSESIFCIDFSPKRDYIATGTGSITLHDGSTKGNLSIWDVNTGKHLQSIPKNGAIVDMAWNAAGDKIAAAAGTQELVTVVDLFYS